MNTNSNTMDYWDEQWRSKKKYFPVHVMKRIVTLVPEDSSVLDIGSGTGSMLKRLKYQKNCQVYGIDISPFAVFKSNEAGIPATYWDAENLDDFEVRKKFDVVISAHLFEHIIDHDKLATNTSRLTKKFALICVPNNCAYPEETGEHVRKYNILDLIRLLAPHFESFEDQTVGKHLMLKCLK